MRRNQAGRGVSNLIPRLPRRLSPRHRRWQQLLASCSIDPDALPAPIEEPGSSDVMICGHSRSGTALVTAALWQPPSVVTVMEPWDAFRLAPADLFRSLRTEMATTGQISCGRLDVAALEEEGAVRWQRDGERAVDVTYGEDTVVVAKMPVFWRYLDRLPETRFIVCVRNPIEVISSYARVGGRLAEGLDYDIPFNSKMNQSLLAQTDDALLRQIAMFDYVADRLIPHLTRSNVHVVRYEDWATDALGQMATLGEFLGVELGPLRVSIRSGETPEPDAETAALIAQNCRTAGALGYDLNGWVHDASGGASPVDSSGPT